MDWQDRKKQMLANSSAIGRLAAEIDDEARFSTARDTWHTPRPFFHFGSAESEPEFVGRITKIAGGAQPAVVKLISYGGAKRLNNMLNYISRQGGIKIETYTGEEITEKEIATVPAEWEPLLDGRAASRDLAKFSIMCEDLPRGDERKAVIGDILTTSFGDRSFAYRVNDGDDGKTTITGVVVLRSKTSGTRMTGDKLAAKIVNKKLDEEYPAYQLKCSFRGYGNGVEYGSSRLARLFGESGGHIITNDGTVIKNAEEGKKLVQTEWRKELYSRKPRDVAHLLVSARAGTDVQKFTDAARDFFAKEFGEPGHKYVFAVHDPSTDVKTAAKGGKRPHVHVHAIITTKNVYGGRLSINRATFRHWRVAMAQTATRYGVEMVMTDRRDTLSAPAFRRNEARPVSYSANGKTVYEGITPSGEKRLENKRANKITIPNSSQSKDYINHVKTVYNNLIHTTDNQAVKDFAKKMLDRFDERKQTTPTHDIINNIIKGINNMANAPTAADFKQYRQSVDNSLERLHSVVKREDRAVFDELAKSANAVIKSREEAIGAQDRLDRARYGDQAVNTGNALLSDIDRVKNDKNSSTDKNERSVMLDKTIANAVNVAIRDNNQYLQEQLAKQPDTARVLDEKKREVQSRKKDDRER